jgi:hypothetical protein
MPPISRYWLAILTIFLFLQISNSHPDEAALLEAYVQNVVTAAPCGCVGCCPPPVPKCCDPRCPKCIGGDVPYPGRRCQFACPGGGCLNQCPCDACVCCYTTHVLEFETTTCLNQAVFFKIGLEVSTQHIYVTTITTVTSELTFSAEEVYVFTSLYFSTLTDTNQLLTSTTTTDVTTSVVVSIGLNTFTSFSLLTILETGTSTVEFTPAEFITVGDPSSTFVIDNLTFSRSVLGSIVSFTQFTPLILESVTATTFITPSSVISTVPNTVTLGYGSTVSIFNSVLTSTDVTQSAFITITSTNGSTSTFSSTLSATLSQTASISTASGTSTITATNSSTLSSPTFTITVTTDLQAEP